MDSKNVSTGQWREPQAKVRRPPWADIDRDLMRRPGVVWTRGTPHPFPNTHYPPERQEGIPAAPLHGRPHKTMPPVFGTGEPLHGVSGMLRKFAARYPDHLPRYWLIRMFADRVDVWGHRAKKIGVLAVPVVAVGLIGRRILRAAQCS